jgi:hypothetical protein
LGWVGNQKDACVPPFDKQVYNGTGTVLVQAGTECEYSDRYREIGKAFGLEPAADKNHSGRDWQAPLEKFTADSPIARLVLTYCAHNFGEHSATKVRALAKLFKVNVEKISSDAEKELASRSRDELTRARKSEQRCKKK